MLLTKLHIPVPGKNLVHRTALFSKLNEGLVRKLILVSAPAGFGKTTVVSDWINQNGIKTTWFSIDENDNDFVGFFDYIISGLQINHENIGKGALELLKSPNTPGKESIIQLLVNDIVSCGSEIVLIIDDFHLISNSEIIQAISYLLEYMPGNMHLILLSRSDPGIPVARLRSQNQLIEIRSSDLSFSVNDISTLFNRKLQIKLSIEDIHSLETKTEGWIAGLHLAALSMQGHDNKSEFVNALAGNNRYIMDYLIEEVLKQQADEVKDFLLKTSILEQFSAPLCNAVLCNSNCQVLLEQLENNNMFVYPLDNERIWFRYHHLFADLLKQRLQLENKSIYEELHDNACNWYAENGMYDLAINHAFEIKNYNKSIKLLENIVEELWLNGQHTAIHNYGVKLPDELIIENALFCLYYSWVLIIGGQPKKAEMYLIGSEVNIRKLIEEGSTSVEITNYNKQLLGKVSVAFAYLYSHYEESDKTFQYCETAMEYLSDQDLLWISWAWFSYGISYYSEGMLHDSLKAFNKAFDYAIKTGNIYLLSTIVIRMAENEQQLGSYKSAYNRCLDLIGMIEDKGYSSITKADWTYAGLYFIMGVSEFIWIEFDKAFENIKTAYELSKDGNDMFLKVFVLMVYTVLLHEMDSPLFQSKKTELDEMLRENEITPFLMSFYIGWKVHLFIEDKQFEKAEDFIREHGLELENKKTYFNETAYASYARLLMAQGKLIEAENLTIELFQLVEEGQHIERMIDLNNILAIIHNKRGNESKAISYLMKSLEMAAKENLLSYFVYNTGEIKELLYKVFKVHATTQTNVPKKFVKNLKLAIERKEKTKKRDVISDLSARELDTLRLIAENLTNQEVAEKLFISLNTVKTHLKNINLKLEVDSRSKAVAKAKEIGLI